MYRLHINTFLHSFELCSKPELFELFIFFCCVLFCCMKIIQHKTCDSGTGSIWCSIPKQPHWHDTLHMEVSEKPVRLQIHILWMWLWYVVPSYHIISPWCLHLWFRLDFERWSHHSFFGPRCPYLVTRQQKDGLYSIWWGEVPILYISACHTFGFWAQQNIVRLKKNWGQAH